MGKYRPLSIPKCAIMSSSNKHYKKLKVFEAFIHSKKMTYNNQQLPKLHQNEVNKYVEGSL